MSWIVQLQPQWQHLGTRRLRAIRKASVTFNKGALEQEGFLSELSQGLCDSINKSPLHTPSSYSEVYCWVIRFANVGKDGGQQVTEGGFKFTSVSWESTRICHRFNLSPQNNTPNPKLVYGYREIYAWRRQHLGEFSPLCREDWLVIWQVW